jgi:hypothetical protein
MPPPRRSCPSSCLRRVAVGERYVFLYVEVTRRDSRERVHARTTTGRPAIRRITPLRARAGLRDSRNCVVGHVVVRSRAAIIDPSSLLAARTIAMLPHEASAHRNVRSGPRGNHASKLVGLTENA